jgi:hypothetical protein
MDDYDGIYNCNSLNYSPFENFEKKIFIIFNGDQNIRFKNIVVMIKPFFSCVVHFKGFSPTCMFMTNLNLYITYLPTYQDLPTPKK